MTCRCSWNKILKTTETERTTVTHNLDENYYGEQKSQNNTYGIIAFTAKTGKAEFSIQGHTDNKLF